jgi:hypothetical protein
MRRMRGQKACDDFALADREALITKDRLRAKEIETANALEVAEIAKRRDLKLAEQIFSNALRYRSQAPLVDAVLAEIGLSMDQLTGLQKPLSAMAKTPPIESN